MSFWTNPQDAYTPFAEPKRPYRFVAKIANFLGGSGLNATRAEGLPEYLWYAKSFDKPSFTIESSAHRMINKTFKYPKTVTWNDVKITLVDTDCPSVAELVGRYLEDAGGPAGYGPNFYSKLYVPPTSGDPDSAMVRPMSDAEMSQYNQQLEDSNQAQATGTGKEVYTTVTKASAVAALGEVKIWQLDPCGRALEEWQLHGAWIKEANFGKLSYDNNDFVEIELTISYDWAVVAVGGTPNPETALNSEINQNGRMSWWNDRNAKNMDDATRQPSRLHLPNRNIYRNSGVCETPAVTNTVQEPGQESTIESTGIPVFDGIIDENIG